jgi:hypothetical protein
MSADGPHTSHVSVVEEGNRLTCALSKSAARNIAGSGRRPVPVGL